MAHTKTGKFQRLSPGCFGLASCGIKAHVLWVTFEYRKKPVTRPRAETLAIIQKPSDIKGTDHKNQKYVQWDMIYLGVYKEGGSYFG